jgi:ABC-type polysaccharide transport system permease subunit
MLKVSAIKNSVQAAVKLKIRPVNTPDRSVASVAWLVSVFVGAEVNLTLMLGYFASKSLISTWRTSLPLMLFVAIIVLAGLVLIPGDLYEAAEVDGSSGWSTFWRITVPVLRPTLVVSRSTGRCASADGIGSQKHSTR